MEKHIAMDYVNWKPNISATKTRQEICDEYNMSYKVFARKLKFHSIELPPGVLTPKYQMMVYEAFGPPPPKIEIERDKKGKR